MNRVTLGFVGGGRATELHVGALHRIYGVDVRLKTVMTRHRETCDKAIKRFGFGQSTQSFDDLLNDPEIDVIDICAPPYTHLEMAKAALKAGKHVICEKPLHGYFSQDEKELIGLTVDRKTMYEKVCKDIEEIRELMKKTDRKFMYAENFVYAPAVNKAAEIIKARKSRILYLKGEESLKGSSSPVAGEWSRTGGGSLMRVGSHPLSAILYLKAIESKARGVPIVPVSVMADVTNVTNSLTEYEHRHIAARPKDVEDISTVIVSFSDGSRACVIATDTLLGGSKNYVEVYCNDASLYCQLTMNDLMETYMLDEDGMDDVYLSEMLPSKCGWNKPFIADEIIRGYADEMQDFMSCIAENREPKSDLELAYNTAKVIYAAYYSSEQGRRVDL